MVIPGLVRHRFGLVQSIPGSAWLSQIIQDVAERLFINENTAKTFRNISNYILKQIHRVGLSKQPRNFIHNEEMMPFDQHELLALIAPRHLAVHSATQDIYADPKESSLLVYMHLRFMDFLAQKDYRRLKCLLRTNPLMEISVIFTELGTRSNTKRLGALF